MACNDGSIVDLDTPSVLGADGNTKADTPDEVLGL
jgi:hypothetical protein